MDMTYVLGRQRWQGRNAGIVSRWEVFVRVWAHILAAARNRGAVLRSRKWPSAYVVRYAGAGLPLHRAR